MTQAARPTLNAASDDGITLSTKFNNATAALYTSHAGAAAPPSPEKGQPWVDTSGEGGSPSLHVLKIYDGTTFRTMGTLDRTAGTYAVAGNLSLAGGSLTGALLLAFGTAALPGAAFVGDPDTGMFRVSANMLGFSTGGVQRVAFDTTNMIVDLAAITQNAATPILTLNRASGAAGSNQLRFQSGGSNRWAFNISGNETGANAGSTFFLQLFDDAGTLVTNYVQMQRATRQTGLNGAIVNDNVLGVRTTGTGASEAALGLLNPVVANDSQVRQTFSTGASSIRASLLGVREGATNNGGLWISTFVGTTESLVMYAGSNGSATFMHDIVVNGSANVSTNISVGGALGVSGNINGANITAAGTLLANSATISGAGNGVSFSTPAFDGNYTTIALQHNNLGGFTPSLLMLHIPGSWYGFRFSTSNGGTFYEMQHTGVIVRSTDSYQVQWVPPSDERIKTNVTAISEDALALLRQVNIVSFNWDPDSTVAPKTTDRVRAGVIAQQLQTIFPEAVTVRPVPELEGGLMSADPGVLIPWLIRAMQQQQELIETLSSRIAVLEAG